MIFQSMHKHSHISVAEDFSKFPSGRLKIHSNTSGEAFRELLVSKLDQNDSVSVSLDGTMGFGSNWLQEAFGGLVNEELFTAEGLTGKLTIFAADESLIVEVWSYINKTRTRNMPLDMQPRSWSWQVRIRFWGALFDLVEQLSYFFNRSRNKLLVKVNETLNEKD